MSDTLEPKLLHHIQRDILRTLLTVDSARFKDLKPAGLESNIFMYHLKALIKDNLVEKTETGYAMTSKGKHFVDRASGIQLNRLPWHITDYHAAFEKIARTIPVARIILQVAGAQMDELRPNELADKLRGYSPFVSTVLLDSSCGTGKELDPVAMRPFIEALYGQEDMPSIAVAGGLKPSNVRRILTSLIADFPLLSFDAETGLRDNYDKTNPRVSRFSEDKAREFAEHIIALSVGNHETTM